MTPAAPFHFVAGPRNHRGLPRPAISAAWLNIIVSGYIMAACNATFWRRGYDIFDGNLTRQLVFGAAIWAVTLLTVTLFGFRWLQKPVLIGLLVLSSVTSYYMDTLGVVIDRDMIQNAATTTFTESRHLITPGFIGHVLVFGLLPAALVVWLRVRPRRFWRDLGGWVALSLASVALFAGLLMTDFKAYAAVLREHKDLAWSYQPGAPLAGAFSYAKMMAKAQDIVVAPLGRDAIKGPLLSAAVKPVLTVIVAGETARAQNFGLNGYGRDTTPELAARGVINFTDVSSCGTATAVSLPCMFSSLGREDYSFEGGIGNENLLDVLSHAGVRVEWWDNNTGDKLIAKRVSRRSMTAMTDPVHCGAGECTDAIFLDFLAETAATMIDDTVVVLHQIGSHGPAYYLRYPPEYERFAPACNSAEFDKCTPAEITNAYDNTIAFTDHVLASTIDMLKAQERVIPALIYVSDHGESLGESGLYLHGAPYFMAPEHQTKVPMLMWLSPAYTETLAVDTACLGAKTGQPLSHDNLFHSVLGLLDIQTAARQPGLDLLADCRNPVSG